MPFLTALMARGPRVMRDMCAIGSDVAVVTHHSRGAEQPLQMGGLEATICPVSLG